MPTKYIYFRFDGNNFRLRIQVAAGLESRHVRTQRVEQDTCLKGRVARKLFNANPGLKVNRSSNFSSIKKFFTAYVLCRLRLFKLKTEGQTI